jgi:membrane protein
VAIAGVAFGHAAASGEIAEQIRGLVGTTGAAAIQSMVESASRQRAGMIATVIGVATLVFGASGVFGELQSSLNTIWHVAAKPGHSLWLFLRRRFLSFAMVLGIGFLLLVSLLLSAAIGGLGLWLAHHWPVLSGLVDAGNIVTLFVISTLLFALIFKALPDVHLDWSDVWIGAGVTSALFGLGRWAIGLYLGHGAVASSYGAAGSLAVFLIWIYFSAQAFLIGAEFTKAFATSYGSRVQPKALAEWADAEGRPRPGAPPPPPAAGGQGRLGMAPEPPPGADGR